MAIKQQSRAAQTAKYFGRRFSNNIKGVAALEFAMIVPMLFMMLIGTFEFGTALTVDRRVSKISSSIADLVSRADKVSEDQLRFMGNQIARSMLEPYDFSNIQINVLQIKADIDDATKTDVDWSRSYSNTGPISSPYSQGSTFTMPTGLMSAGTYMIVTEVTYDYTPLIFSKSETQGLTGLQGASPGAYTMREIFYLSPRTKACVSLANINCVTGNSF